MGRTKQATDDPPLTRATRKNQRLVNEKEDESMVPLRKGQTKKKAKTKEKAKKPLQTPVSNPPCNGNKRRSAQGKRGTIYDPNSRTTNRSILSIQEPQQEDLGRESEGIEIVLDDIEREGEDKQEDEEGEKDDELPVGKGEKEKAAHIPSKDNMLPECEDGKPWGLPQDNGDVLFGYKDSWACTIYSTRNHRDATRVFRRQTAEKWDLSGECERVKKIVEESGLLFAAQNQVSCDSVTVSALAERYHGETSTFHFKEAELGIIPDDAKEILGLPIRGKAVMDGYKEKLPWPEMHELTKRLFGWDLETSKEKFYNTGKCTLRQFKLAELKKCFEGTKDLENKGEEITNERVTATAAAYLLYILGTIIFPGSKGNRVNANFLQLLDPVDRVCQYSWGTAVVAHLNLELVKASKTATCQISGNLTLLQVWAYEHFPTLFADNTDYMIVDNWDNSRPRASRHCFHGIPKAGNRKRLLELREKFDNLPVEQIVFSPYKKEREEIPETDVSLYNGPLFYMSGYVIYNPYRVMRQLGYKQDVSYFEDKFPVDKEASKSTNHNTFVVPKNLNKKNPVVHWNQRELENLVDASKWESTVLGYEAVNGWLGEYNEYAHPLVIRPPSVEVPRPKKKTVSVPTPPSTAEGIPTPPIVDPVKRIVDLVKKRTSRLVNKMRCKTDKGETLTIAEMEELYTQLANLTDEEARKMFGERKRVRASTSQAGRKTKLKKKD